MTRLSDLPRDMVEEIFSRIPLTSLNAVRCTCKIWNTLSKNHVLGTAATTRNQFMGFMKRDSKVCSIKLDLHNNSNDIVDVSIKQLRKVKHDVLDVLHCDGLLLCVLKDYLMLEVLNPYLGQIRWIELSSNCTKFDMFVFGYDNNHNHKILKIMDDYEGKALLSRFEIYEFNSHSWKVLDVKPDWDICFYQSNLSLKGNGYVLAVENVFEKEFNLLYKHFLLCFDFTTERFGPRLSLPFLSRYGDIVILSCVGQEKLAVLFQHRETMKIWITTKIEPDAVLWSKFLDVDNTLLYKYCYPPRLEATSLLIDEEKEVAVVSERGRPERTETSAYIIGQDGHFKSVKIGDSPRRIGYPPVFSSYFPSLVQLEIQQLGKRKERDY